MPGTHVCRDVKVSVKVQLIGMGNSKNDVKLAACLGPRTLHNNKRKRNKWAERKCTERAILEFQASSHLSHLTIFATLGPCVLHKSGSLTIDKCSLICSFHPLEHLNIPIVTYAQGEEDEEEEDCFGGSSSIGGEYSSFGKLDVKETQIEGGNKAVEINSRNNVLREVRTCFLSSTKLFWFRVSGEAILNNIFPTTSTTTETCDAYAEPRKRRKLLDLCN
jgi:hypothetical protein